MLTTILIQTLGLIGWLLLLLSYWREDINKLLFLQLISGVFYAFHYYFIGAIEGVFVIIFELFRDFSYYKTNLDKYIFIGTIPIYIIYSLLNFTGLVSIFPCIASIIDGYSLSYNKNSAVIGAIIAEVLWIIYDGLNGSYIGIVTGAIMIVSNIMAMMFERRNNYNKT